MTPPTQPFDELSLERKRDVVLDPGGQTLEFFPVLMYSGSDCIWEKEQNKLTSEGYDILGHWRMMGHC